MKIGIMPHTGKKLALELTKKTVNYLEAKSIIPWIDGESAALIQRNDLAQTESGLKNLDVMVVLGGDGTLLRAARTMSDYNVPILGVNVGHLGFLTELEADKIEAALDMIISKNYTLDERMFIECKVIRNKRLAASYRALNDVVITRGTFARIIQLSTYVDSQHVVDYQADGIIIATPTGSTAYSLSAGGPIVEPSLDCLIITPICPHTLAARSFVVRHDSVVEVKVEANHEDMMLTIDGQISFPLQSYDLIEVVQSTIKAKFVKLHQRSFFTILNNRMKSIQTRKEYESEG
ncbi:MAG: NAD(+)/NADH kinase [Firmicutes bacterium]|nr:NAD(+)/NADH kinase [Bacillota bacterium]